jgi:hypothetical protein
MTGGRLNDDGHWVLIKRSILINAAKSPGGMRVSRTGTFLDTARLAGFPLNRSVTEGRLPTTQSCSKMAFGQSRRGELRQPAGFG